MDDVTWDEWVRYIVAYKVTTPILWFVHVRLHRADRRVMDLHTRSFSWGERASAARYSRPWEDLVRWGGACPCGANVDEVHSPDCADLKSRAARAREGAKGAPALRWPRAEDSR